MTFCLVTAMRTWDLALGSSLLIQSTNAIMRNKRLLDFSFTSCIIFIFIMHRQDIDRRADVCQRKTKGQTRDLANEKQIYGAMHSRVADHGKSVSTEALSMHIHPAREV